MSSLLESAQTLLDTPIIRQPKSYLQSMFFRSAQPVPSRTDAALDILFGPSVPQFVSLFSQLCRLTAVAIVLPILLMGLADFAGYAVVRLLGLHRQRVRVKRPPHDGPPRIAKRTARHYQSDRGRPTDYSNVPSIVKAPLLSPGTYDAETLLRHRARSLSAASEDFDRAYIASGGYFARVGAEQEHAYSTDGEEEVKMLSSSEVRVPGIGVDGAMGFLDTDGESGTESGRNSPTVARFARPHSGRRRGLSGGLKFTKVQDDVEPVTAPSIVATTATVEMDMTRGSDSLGGSWIGVESAGDISTPPGQVAAAAAAAADLEIESSF